MANYHYRYAEFGPSETARLTGVSPDQQRDWRRRGILPSIDDSRTRLFAPYVAQILVRRAMNDAGVPLTEAPASVAMATMLLLFQAQAEPGALVFEDGIDPEIVAEVRSGPATDTRYLVFPRPFLTPDQISDLTGKAVGKSLEDILPAWPASSMAGIADTAETFQRFGIATFSVVDLGALGAKFAREAERPICSVRKGPKVTDTSAEAG